MTIGLAMVTHFHARLVIFLKQMTALPGYLSSPCGMSETAHSFPDQSKPIHEGQGFTDPHVAII